MPDNGQVDQIDGWNGDLIPVKVDQSIKSSTAQGGNWGSIFLFEGGFIYGRKTTTQAPLFRR